MNKQEVMEKVQVDATLSQIAEIEPESFEHLVDQALAHPVGIDRWPAYSRLKSQASEIVGWYAAHQQLATNAHYDALIALIDEMLPASSDDDVSDYDDLAPRRKADRGFVHISVLIDEFMRDLEQKRSHHDDQAG